METLPKFLLIVSFLFLICELLVCEEEVIVETKLGLVKGYTRSHTVPGTGETITTTRFLGIPFASPPLGTLRFQMPRPMIEPWGKTVGSKKPKLPCYQTPVLLTNNSYRQLKYGQDPKSLEDCLYLNIWVPPKGESDQKKSVLFWIPGSDFYRVNMYPEPSNYDGDVLAYYGDIIVVVTNYRMGYLGFWTNGSPDAPGNVGLVDVIVALSWVQDYIEAFGGNPKSVTIGGQDAGAIIVTLLPILPYAQNLFHRQIVQSSTAMWKFDTDTQHVLVKSRKLAESFECTLNYLDFSNSPTLASDCLREYKHIAFGEDAFLMNHVWPYNIFPTEDSFPRPRPQDAWKTFPALFPRKPSAHFLTHQYNNMELLIGSTGDEGAYLIHRQTPGLEWDIQINRSDAVKFLKRHLTDHFFVSGDEDPIATEEIIKTYFPKATSDADIEYKGLGYGERYIQALGDFLFRCPTIFYATLIALSPNTKVYYYDFQHRPSHSKWPQSVGATHSDEMFFVFGDPIVNIAFNGTYVPEERRLSKKIIKHWSNFVKYGIPHDDWPQYGTTFTSKVYLNEIDEHVDTPHDTHNCRLWFEYIFPKQDGILLLDHEKYFDQIFK